MNNNRKAFTMLELIFVIVVIGILSAIAVPKFAVTQDKAKIVKAKTLVSSIRNAVATERQQRILRGKFTPIKKLTVNTGMAADQLIFEAFDGNTSAPVLQYPPLACENQTSVDCWYQSKSSVPTEYTYNMPLAGSAVFVLQNNRFDCKSSTDANCKLLTR